MPREIVFRLKGDGDRTPLGDVDEPVFVVVGVVPVAAPVPVAVPVPGVVVALGEVSGENTPPSAYSERFNPYVLTRLRSTSRISTSTTISARGLSFCSMIFSRICTTAAVARTVNVFVVLLTAIAGCTAMPGRRMMTLRSCEISVGSAFDR